ncbi:TonB-dependent receptor [Gammaproteobacteria bacterium]|nr:TonB-dependent receptor [Gammaproteobacteria bacterium]
MKLIQSFIFSLVLFTGFSFAQDVEEVVVTGSYLKGSAEDGASPVEVISRDTIDLLGATSVADITANLTVNSGSENNPDSFTAGSTQGTSNVNLRGLGLSSTLVLIDGRRNAVAANTANDGSVFVDTNSIPVIALERVEVLKEGAASIYGSDAVAGVVNYILRRDFEGVEVNISQSKTDLGDQTDDRVGVIWGKDFGNTNVVVAYSELNRSPFEGKDLSAYSENAISGFGNSFAVLNLPSLIGGFNGTTIGGILADPLTEVASGPYAGFYYYGENVPDSNCVANDGILVPTANIYGAVPGLGDFDGGQRCGFYYGDRFNLVNDEDHTSIYTSVKTTLDNGVGFELDYMATDVNVNDNPQSPSYPALSYLGIPIMPGMAGSPFATPVLWIGRALGSAFPSPLAPRENQNSRVSMGFNGVLDNGMDWDVHYTESSQSAYIFQPDTSTSRFGAAINGVGGASGNESWNLFDPTSNSASLIDYISSGEERWTDSKLQVFDVVLTGERRGWDVAAGFQYKNELFKIVRNDESTTLFAEDGSISQQSDLIFLGGGLESKSRRDSTAFFVEAGKDLTDKLSFKGAARFENLDSESTYNPKASLRYQMSDELVLRGSYSTSFREPSLSQLSSSLVSLQGLQDFNTDGTPRGSVSFIRVAVAKNENLTPEESDNMNFGAIWTPNDQTSVTLDYWTVDYKNVVTLESAQGKIIANPDSTDIIRTNGTLVGVTTSYFNAASIDASGFDLEATYSFDTPLGQASIGLNTARMLEYKIPNGAGGTKDVVGLFNHDNFARSMPETKSVITGMLSNGNHNFAAFIRNVSEYETTRAIPASAAANGYTQDIDSFTTLDLKYTFDLEWGESMITLSAGVNNATDEEAPQVYDAANFSYDAKHHDPRGVMSYLGFKITL